jgi:choline dehydrogenase-like flavoprotein
VAAAVLAAAGKHVIVLEAGGGEQAPDFDQRELGCLERMYLDGGLAASGDLSIALLAGATLGGGTTINWQTTLALPEEIRAEWARSSGCEHFVGEGFARSLAAVGERIHAGTAESVVNGNNAALRDGCAALGQGWRMVPRNAHGCVTEECGFCVFGCRRDAKQSSAVTFLADAQSDGAEVVVRCRAERVLFAHGRVQGVEATARDGAGAAHRLLVRCPVVVAAAGGVHSPALLARSGVALPALGRHLFLHPATSVAGVYEQRIEPWNGPPQSVLCDDFAAVDGGHGFRLETAPAHPGLLALATPWFGAAAHRREMERSAHKAAFIVLVRDVRGGRVRVDRRGEPIVEYTPDARTHALLRRGVAVAARVHLAAGAREVLSLHSRRHQLVAARGPATPEAEALYERLARSPLTRNWSALFSAHQMGSCRMGGSARDAVCDENGEVFGARGLYVADASAFPAASGVNPMQTIMALAHHTAQRIR